MFWAFFFWMTEKNVSLANMLITSHMLGFCSIVMILLALWIFNPVSFILRVVAISVSGNTGNLIALLITPYFTGEAINSDRFIEIMSWTNLRLPSTMIPPLLLMSWAAHSALIQ